jgi:hypothetical protein
VGLILYAFSSQSVRVIKAGNRDMGGDVSGMGLRDICGGLCRKRCCLHKKGSGARLGPVAAGSQVA